MVAADLNSLTLCDCPVTFRRVDGRIEFVHAPIELKDEIKAMAGSKWHGHIKGDGRQLWSVRDCGRNWFQIRYLAGEQVYAWFDRPLVRHTYRDYFRRGVLTPPGPHQHDLADALLTYHFQIWAAEMGVGKTLAAQMAMEASGVRDWYWIGPKVTLDNIRREFDIWGRASELHIQFGSYEWLTKHMNERDPAEPVFGGVIFDEASKLKTAAAKRSQAAQRLADQIRQEHGMAGYVCLASGTPSPKTPVDWWSLAEICWPGYLREGSPQALESRLAFQMPRDFGDGIRRVRSGWRDDVRKCKTCGEHRCSTEFVGKHKYASSKNEVHFLSERLAGITVVKRADECITLPEVRFERIYCEPTATMRRVAKQLVEQTSGGAEAFLLLRELSDGFQYRQAADGELPCGQCDNGAVLSGYVDGFARWAPCEACDGSGKIAKLVRQCREVPCPKDKKLGEIIDLCEETGRVVIFAGFQGSIDRCTRLCQRKGYDVVQCDGRGFFVVDAQGELIDSQKPLDYWADTERNERVAFVANPESGGMSFTLVESREIGRAHV